MFIKKQLYSSELTKLLSGWATRAAERPFHPFVGSFLKEWIGKAIRMTANVYFIHAIYPRGNTFVCLEANITKQQWLWVIRQGSTANNFALLRQMLVCRMYAKILAHGVEDLVSLMGNGRCKQHFSPQHSWCPWLGIKPATLNLAGQGATNQATGAGERNLMSTWDVRRRNERTEGKLVKKTEP